MSNRHSALALILLVSLLTAACGSAEPAATLPLTATRTPSPPTDTPVPTETALPPTGTAVPTETPEPTNTPEPTATETPEPTPTIKAPSDEQVLANLIAFSRLYGYVRYFHPSDEAARLNWERVAINGVAAIKGAEDAADLAQKLQAFFQPCAPTLRVFPVDERPEQPAELAPPEDADGLQVVMWQHYGVEGEYVDSIYHSERITATVLPGEIPEGFHDPSEPFYAELGGDVAVLVPLALFADGEGTLPRVTLAGQEPPDKGTAPGAANRRLADVVIAWNVFQHFYPYFDVVDTDWSEVMEEALVGALQAADEAAHHDVLRRLLAQLYDGHARTYQKTATDIYVPHIRLSVVEDSLVVLDAGGKAALSVAPGDVVLKIDGRQATKVLAELEELTSGATLQWRHERALRELLIGPMSSKIRLEIRKPSGEEILLSLARTVGFWSIAPQGPRPKKVTELEPGIMYVDLTRVEDEDFEAALPQLEAADGIIFDLRGYPQVSKDTIGHLIDEPVKSPQMWVPVVTLPDQQNLEFAFSKWEIEPKAPRFKGGIAFLTDGQALSYAETYMSIIEHYRLAEIVGEPTAGTNGDYNQFSVPGKYTIYWTGMKVLKHDGSQHHGVGIQPTIFVSRTIQGIAEGRDEQIERAIEAIKGSP